MIGFLQPLLGLAVLAAGIPILLHLIRRRELRHVTFPAIRYLRRAEERYARRLRLRHLLLLAARVLIIAALAAAAAGPLVGRGGARDHVPTAVAIVLDESLSSARLAGDLRLLDAYLERAAGAVELAGPDDRIALFSEARPDRGALAEGPEAVTAVLHEVRPTAGLARPEAALRQTVAWLRSTGLDALEVHLFTDLQRVSLPGTDDTTETGDPGSNITVIGYAPDLGDEPNGAPGYPEPESAPLDAGLRTRISVPILWWGEASPPESSTVIRLLVEDAVVAVAEAPFGGTSLLTLPPQDSGWVQGYVQIDGHGLAADDDRHFTWFARPTPSVAVTGDAGDFVTRALAALEGGERIRSGSPGEAEVWIAGAGAGLDEALAAERAVVVLPPANALDLPRLNFRLSRASIPWRYESEEGVAGASRLAGPAPIAGLDGQVVRQRYLLRSTAVAGADTALLRLEDGEAWLVRGTRGERAAYLLLASPLIPEATDLPVSAAMVPFIDALVGEWARRGAVEQSVHEGIARVRLPPRAREARLPDGSVRHVEGGSWFVAEAPGGYTITDAAETLLAFSVNAPLAESDLRRGSADALEAVLPSAAWHWYRGGDAASWQNDIFRQRRGRHTWRPLIVLLLVLAVVEASLAAGRRRRVSRPPRERQIADSEAEASEPAVP